ncbi:hypothetical protein [Actinomadura sp. WMMB 499]|uniref:hypothetical protein n=1 Tax=Actinomadura sp. WMMB 499 TaxID=1219491 RepID=UPI001246B583|nr:hypothetical protein [Actinomadura sp. WMMB 499]QFG25151.1 hypothetical protein F7P10_32445 [Actinomadura sp. WMMB 499]
MIIGILVCGILAYALFDVGRTLVRRMRGSAARAAAESRPFEARTAEAHAAAWANELETVEEILGAEALWTEADQEWLESRRISLPT